MLLGIKIFSDEDIQAAFETEESTCARMCQVTIIRVYTFYFIESSDFLLYSSFVLSSFSPTSDVWREVNK